MQALTMSSLPHPGCHLAGISINSTLETLGQFPAPCTLTSPRTLPTSLFLGYLLKTSLAPSEHIFLYPHLYSPTSLLIFLNKEFFIDQRPCTDQSKNTKCS